MAIDFLALHGQSSVEFIYGRSKHTPLSLQRIFFDERGRPMKIRISEQDHGAIRRLTAVSFRRDVRFPPETGCILLISRNDHPLNPSLLVAGVLEPDEGELTECASDGLTFSSKYLRRALLEV